MIEKGNLFWHLDQLDIEAERIEFESTLSRSFCVDRLFIDDCWEYKDDATRLAFEGWTLARLSSWVRAAAKADGGLLTESIDTEAFHQLASSWKDGGDAVWSDIIDHVVNHMHGEVLAQVKFCLSAEEGD